MWDDLFDPAESAGFFRAEAEALLGRIDAERPKLERSLESGTANVGAIDEVLDALRSLQRGSVIVGYRDVHALATQLERLYEIVRDGDVPLAESGVEMLVSGRAFLGELVAAAPAASRALPDFDDYVERLERLVAIYAETARIRRPNAAAQSPGAPTSESEPASAVAAPPVAEPAVPVRSLNVDVDRLDDIAACVADVAMQTARLAALGGAAGASVPALERATREMQAALVATRRTTAGCALGWLPADVSAFAEAAGKRVEVEFAGRDAPFDRAIEIQARDAVSHLLRYVVDFDVEMPADRERARKPAAATLVVTAFACGNQTVIEFVEDGAGKKAADAPLVRAAKAAAERLNGSLAVDAIPGRGLYAAMKFPLPVAMLRSLVVRAGGDAFALPFDTIVAVQPIAERDEAIPLFGVAEFFGVEPAGPERFAIVVEVRGGKAALSVERVEGEQPVAVRPLGRLAGTVHGMTGAAVLADGSIALVLDASAFVMAAARRGE